MTQVVDLNSCKLEFVAEVAMVITSFIILTSVLSLSLLSGFKLDRYPRIRIRSVRIRSAKESGIFLSVAYDLFLPLVSYMSSAVAQHNQEGRNEVILIWTVLIEVIRVSGEPIFTWTLRKSLEQMVRLFWVSFLVYNSSNRSLQGTRLVLFIICISLAVSEILKGIIVKLAKGSCLIAKNPNIIHNYVKTVMLHDDLMTTPMDCCDYIVLGEQNHKIAILPAGYVIGEKLPNSKGILTIGRAFELNNLDDTEAFTSRFPNWRDTCLSFALAKMLRRRFAKLPVDEAGCQKALDFVLIGLIDYIGSNRDIQTNGNDGAERKTENRVFSIIQEELKFISDFLHISTPTYYYFPGLYAYDFFFMNIIFGNLIYLTYVIFNRSSAWLSHGAEENNNCILNVFSHGSVVEIIYHLDQAITTILVLSCICIQYTGWITKWFSVRWSNLRSIEAYIKDPYKWNRINSHNSLAASKKVLPKPQAENIEEAKVDSIFYVSNTNIPHLPMWLNRIIDPKLPPTVSYKPDAEETILKFLRSSEGQLTNGETSLRNNQMEHLKWACQSNGSTTTTILVWHIATTLFHHQEPSPQQNNNPCKEQEVDLSLSSYYHYLVKYLPELLPDMVEWTNEMYKFVRKELLEKTLFSNRKPTEKQWCEYVLQAMWYQSSIVGKGVILAKDLVKCSEDGKHVWTMLAEFWAEMMLFIAPSENVEAHEKILERGELITQLWALLTHAGIITRPKPTEHLDDFC